MSPQAPAPAKPAHLPYGRQWIDDDDVAAVVAALRSDLIAHGPRVGDFEAAFAAKVGADHAVAVSSGTAALHVALTANDIGQGCLCVVPAITFLATATAARLCGAEVLFADVDPLSGLMTPDTLARALGPDGQAAAVLPVHLTGRLCDLEGLCAIAAGAGAMMIEDACHALGGAYPDGAAVGSCRRSQAATFSFHPVKTLAAGEGGMIATNDGERAARMRRLRNHGVTHDPSLMGEAGSFDAAGDRNPWSYEQLELGFNYRMNELEAALGLSQLAKLDMFIARRRLLADRYRETLSRFAPVVRLCPPGEGSVGPHLLCVLVDFDRAGVGRAQVMRALAAAGVGSQVHYIPLYRQPYFRARYGSAPLPGAEAYYARVLALPLFPAMALEDVDRVCGALGEALRL